LENGILEIQAEIVQVKDYKHMELDNEKVNQISTYTKEFVTERHLERREIRETEEIKGRFEIN
jgi:hypothetical protein